MNRHRTIFICLIFLFLTACTSFQPSASERGFSYPIEACTNQAEIEAAQSNLSPLGRSPQQRVPCVTGVAEDGSNTALGSPASNQTKDGSSQQAFSTTEQTFRKNIETPYLRSLGTFDRPFLGIALSGGGSKASAFGIGVLAAFSDTNLLHQTDFVSSVSGGSYAAYFLYAQSLFPDIRRDSLPPPLQDLFVSCVRSAPNIETVPHISREMDGRRCPSIESPNGSPKLPRYQAFAGCNQDLFRPGRCSFKNSTDSGGVPVYPVVGTIGLAPITFVGNTLFDWGVGLSPSARSYIHGIGIAFGASPRSEFSFPSFPNHLDHECADSNVRDCDRNGDPVPLTFDELRRGLIIEASEGRRLPFWIINASAPKRRGGFGWLLAVDKDAENDIFEFTALTHGSPRYGYVSTSAEIHGMSVLDAVAASAAFLDENEQVEAPALRGVFGATFHLLNMDWGLDIRNYNVSDTRGMIHKMLPYPLNLLDGAFSMMSVERGENDVSVAQTKRDRVRSSYIRLIDGGNSEDLGVYSLIKRGVRNIVISDAAHDEDGEFQDLCHLRKLLVTVPTKQDRFVLIVPGLKDFDEHCDTPESAKAKMGYNLHDWNYAQPVMLGCVRHANSVTHDSLCKNLGPDDTRLYIVKPAINVRHIADNQWNRNTKQIYACTFPGNGVLGDGITMAALNCETTWHVKDNWDGNHCLAFPQNSTVAITANSTFTLYAAYRELARQYVSTVTSIIVGLQHDEANPDAIGKFNDIVFRQSLAPMDRYPIGNLNLACRLSRPYSGWKPSEHT